MPEAKADEPAKIPTIDWHMSAALENVPRGDQDVAEVTSLQQAVEAWRTLDPPHKDGATLTPERAVLLDGAARARFEGEEIEDLARHLPASADDAG